MEKVGGTNAGCVMPAFDLSDGIVPLQSEKSCEVGIGGAKRAIVLDRQRGQMGIE